MLSLTHLEYNANRLYNLSCCHDSLSTLPLDQLSGVARLSLRVWIYINHRCFCLLFSFFASYTSSVFMVHHVVNLPQLLFLSVRDNSRSRALFRTPSFTHPVIPEYQSVVREAAYSVMNLLLWALLLFLGCFLNVYVAKRRSAYTYRSPTSAREISAFPLMDVPNDGPTEDSL